MEHAFLAWGCHAAKTPETARMLRAAVAMLTRCDMVGTVRVWQSAYRAAATLTHALGVLKDRDLLCAGGLSGTRCERLRCGVCAWR